MKTERFEFKISPKDKRLIRTASTKEQETPSEFTRRAAVEKAKTVLGKS